MSTDEAGSGPGERVVVGSYERYPDAERAVDLLSDEGFPVDRVAIVGTGLRYVEQVAGRVTIARAALTGAGQGALIGLLFALLLGLFFTVAEAFLGVVLYGLVVGALLGAVLGALTHAATGGRRDFSSVASMGADRYEVMADAEVADRARQLVHDKLPEATSEAT